MSTKTGHSVSLCRSKGTSSNSQAWLIIKFRLADLIKVEFVLLQARIYMVLALEVELLLLMPSMSCDSGGLFKTGLIPSYDSCR